MKAVEIRHKQSIFADWHYEFFRNRETFTLQTLENVQTIKDANLPYRVVIGRVYDFRPIMFHLLSLGSIKTRKRGRTMRPDVKSDVNEVVERYLMRGQSFHVSS